MMRGLLLARNVAALVVITSCKTTPGTETKSITRLDHPPQLLYHFGLYQDLQRYAEQMGPPSKSVWESIPSVRVNGAKRSGLYGSQHPGYNERYAADGLSKGLDYGPWLVTIRLSKRCYGPNWDNNGVSLDDRWYNAGFWIIHDRNCIANIQASPEAILEIYAQTPELWHKQPYEDLPRTSDNAGLTNRVLFDILLRAIAKAKFYRPGLWSQILATSSGSDDKKPKRAVNNLVSSVTACADAGLEQSMQKEIEQLLVDSNLLGKFTDGTTPLCQEQPAEAQEEGAIAADQPEDSDIYPIKPGLYRYRGGGFYHRVKFVTANGDYISYKISYGTSKQTTNGHLDVSCVKKRCKYLRNGDFSILTPTKYLYASQAFNWIEP